MYDADVSCCFTGHRPPKLPWGYDETRPDCLRFKERLYSLIHDVAREGCRHFYCGCAQGVDMMAGELTLRLREQLPEVKLVCVRPCDNQAESWPIAVQRRYRELLSSADRVTLLQGTYSEGCMQRRNRYMAERCGTVIAVWDGSTGGTAQTVRMMSRPGGRILLLRPATLETQILSFEPDDGQLFFTE